MCAAYVVGALAAFRKGRPVEELFQRLAEVVETLIEAAAVFIVVYGSAEAFLKLLPVMARPRASHGQRKAIWRRYGTWLLLGLEFELAADIVGSVISPSWMEIGQLGAIAVIRTFLNYFLEKDLEGAGTEEETRGEAADERELASANDERPGAPRKEK
jgi:uncharacterized membrane protein